MTSEEWAGEIERQPHWRVNVRPTEYAGASVLSLAECVRVIEKCAVRLRGWSYPYLNSDTSMRETTATFLGSRLDLGSHKEYWRLYKSTQFLHLFTIREFADKQWDSELRTHHTPLLGAPRGWTNQDAPGCLEITSTVYTICEIFEFTARMIESGVYSRDLCIDIQLQHVDGFILMADVRRSWPIYCAASADTVVFELQSRTTDIVGDIETAVLKASKSVFEQFGWLDPSDEVMLKMIREMRERA